MLFPGISCWNSAAIDFTKTICRVRFIKIGAQKSTAKHGLRYLSAGQCGDSRSRLSDIWIPLPGVRSIEDADGHEKLIRAGYMRQAHSGVFHTLPLGKRVQQKIERLVDKHMRSLGASKVDLSSISSQDLWQRSGRLGKISELFKFEDRRKAQYLLAPTHEEEITTLVASTVKSFKQLPVRLYQISRKYRDELRPRHGLLRSREFIMKDLYTFDRTTEHALSTYDAVRAAYKGFFDELKIPYLVAQADSGDMGGNLSHEYHFPTAVGEDSIISCQKCDYVANEELVESVTVPHIETADPWVFRDKYTDGSPQHDSCNVYDVWRGVTKDRKTLVNVWYVARTPAMEESTADDSIEVNTHAVRAHVPELDSSINNSLAAWLEAVRNPANESKQSNMIDLYDQLLPPTIRQQIQAEAQSRAEDLQVPLHLFNNNNDNDDKPHLHQSLNLLRPRTGSKCPRCPSGTLKVEKAIELGHTFFLGTRYSILLNATVTDPSDKVVPMQMGCHGIGVSRLIGAGAEILSDDKGLNWPRVIAPYEVIVIPATFKYQDASHEVYDALTTRNTSALATGTMAAGTDQAHIDVVLDDRDSGAYSFGWKINDADRVGYPVVVVIGRDWAKDRSVEVQCRGLGVNQTVGLQLLPDFVRDLLDRL